MESQHIICMLIKLRVSLNQKGRVRLTSLLDQGKGSMAMFNTIPGVGSVETMDTLSITVRRNKLMTIGLMSLFTMRVLQTFKSDPRIHTSDTMIIVSDPKPTVSETKTTIEIAKQLSLIYMSPVLINPVKPSFAGYQKFNLSLCRMKRLKRSGSLIVAVHEPLLLAVSSC